MTFDPGTPPADADDHLLAGWLAQVAGRRLLEVRGEGLEGRELKDAGDVAAHDGSLALRRARVIDACYASAAAGREVEVEG